MRSIALFGNVRAGKTVVANLLAAELHGLVLSADLVQSIATATDRKPWTLYRFIIAMAEAPGRRRPYPLILDSTGMSEEYHQIVNELEAFKVVLCCSRTTWAERGEDRDNDDDFLYWKSWTALDHFLDVPLIISTDNRTPDEVVRLILERYRG